MDLQNHIQLSSAIEGNIMEIKIAIKPKVKGYGLVRNKNGEPQIEDIEKCPKEILAMLTKEELKRLQK